MSEDEIQEEPGTDTGANPGGGLIKFRSKYEFVMAAAREAERLNDYYRNNGIQIDHKVTVEAIGRVQSRLSRVVYEEPKQAEEEARKESTYFFGP